MKSLNFFGMSLLMVFSLISNSLQAVNSPVSTPLPVVESIFDLPKTDILQKDVKTLEKQIGRKMRIKEKIALIFTKRKLKKSNANNEEIDFNETRTHGLAIASMVCGIVGLFIFGIVLGILAIIFGAISIGKIKRSGGYLRGKGMAVAGLVLGIVGIALLFVLLAALV